MSKGRYFNIQNCVNSSNRFMKYLFVCIISVLNCLILVYFFYKEIYYFRIKKCKNYYEILGVSKDATNSNIKKAYKRLAHQLHPNKNKAPGATKAFNGKVTLYNCIEGLFISNTFK